MPPGNRNTPRHEGKGCWNGEHEVPYSATRSSIFRPRGHSPQCSLPERLRQTTLHTLECNSPSPVSSLVIATADWETRRPKHPLKGRALPRFMLGPRRDKRASLCPPAMSLPTPYVERIRTPHVQAVVPAAVRKSRVASFNSTQTRRCWKTKGGGVDTAQFEVTTSDVGIMTHIAQVSSTVGPCATACDP